MAEGCSAAPETDCDVLVVGAGLSGLTAAYRAQKLWPADRIIVLEANNRVGGRLLTQELPTFESTDRWDLGGCWIGKTQTDILKLLQELDRETYPQYYDGQKFMQIGSNFSIRQYRSTIGGMSWLSLLDTATFLKKADSDQTKVNIDRPGGSEIGRDLDSQTALSYVRKKAWTRALEDATAAACRVITGAELNAMSALYLVLYAKAAGNFRVLVESSKDSAQSMKIKGGAQTVCTELAHRLGEEKIHFEKAVTAVDYSSDVVTVRTVSTQDDTTEVTYRAKYLIFALPPTLLKKIRFNPHLPAEKENLFNAFQPGHLIKVILTYKTAFWRDMNLSGEIVTNGGPTYTVGCTTGPLCVTFDATTEAGSPALVGFIGGRQALEYDGLPLTDRRNAVLKSLAQFFPEKEVQDFITYEEKNWRHERFCGGAPVAFVSPGSAALLPQARVPLLGRVYFCGSELATRWTGFMSGAVQSAEAAVTELRDIREPRSPASSEEAAPESPSADETPERVTKTDEKNEEKDEKVKEEEKKEEKEEKEKEKEEKKEEKEEERKEEKEEKEEEKEEKKEEKEEEKKEKEDEKKEEKEEEKEAEENGEVEEEKKGDKEEGERKEEEDDMKEDAVENEKAADTEDNEAERKTEENSTEKEKKEESSEE